MSDDPTDPPGDGGSDKANEARRAILARRRRFVAVALASAGVAAGSSSCDKNPLVCLSPVPVEEDAGPTVCLSAPIEETPDAGAGGDDAADAGAGDGDAGVSEDADGGTGDAGSDAGEAPPPRVCLRTAPPPTPKPTAPKPCLKFAPPKDEKLQ